MKRLFCLASAMLILTGCSNKKEEEKEPSYVEPHYQEVEELHIEWPTLFSQPESKYYAYVYAVTCSPCSSLREKITNAAKSGKAKIYFVFPSDDVPFTEDLDQAMSSLGATAIENVYCYSTPTLIEITDKTVSLYTRDYYEIETFLESL